jgi:hypothetical protein
MRAFAIITMFVGWLIYGAVCAWAGCPMCLTTIEASKSPQGTAHEDMNGMAMAGKPAGKAGKAWPGSRLCSGSGWKHIPLCAACVALTPDVANDDRTKGATARLVPGPTDRLREMRAAPIPPPPRFS